MSLEIVRVEQRVVGCCFIVCESGVQADTGHRSHSSPGGCRCSDEIREWPVVSVTSWGQHDRHNNSHNPWCPADSVIVENSSKLKDNTRIIEIITI